MQKFKTLELAPAVRGLYNFRINDLKLLNKDAAKHLERYSTAKISNETVLETKVEISSAPFRRTGVTWCYCSCCHVGVKDRLLKRQGFD